MFLCVDDAGLRSVASVEAVVPAKERSAEACAHADSTSAVDTGGNGAARTADQDESVHAGGLGDVVARVVGGAVAEVATIGGSGQQWLRGGLLGQ